MRGERAHGVARRLGVVDGERSFANFVLGLRWCGYFRRMSDSLDQPTSGSAEHPEPISPLLTAADLVPDQALTKASEDRFGHTVLARRVTELVRSSKPPINIALFGSWGSGKSSVAGLMREQLGGTDVGFVEYNAWKFGGKSLRRNFISNAAKELGLDRKNDHWEKFYDGLYQSKRRVRYRPRDVGRGLNALVLALGILLVSLALLVVIGFVIAWFINGHDGTKDFLHALPDYVQPGGAVALLLLIATAAIGAGRVDIDQSAPGDEEEFSQRFCELRDAVLHPSREDKAPAKLPDRTRIVFFIDELDRCDEKDVVQTLTSVRSFLDEDDCVFVIAADRDVLEIALQREVEQATPTDIVSPYYTTAGAFLDKIFAHQIEVPPLRGRRLTRFARELVRDRGGLWGEISAAGGEAALDGVVYALVPAHVSSPRRIKVLLNNFATNARIAEGRKVDWLGRAEEIAKLTALQTEFPALGRDLILEPRLPRFLLNPEDDEITPRARLLLNRHRLDPPKPPDDEGEVTEGPEAPGDREDLELYLNEGDDEAAAVARKRRSAEMRTKHRAQLRRYLERTAAVTNPQRDLLYGEAAGAAVDMTDPELGELIEERAPEAPDEVISKVEELDDDEQQNAAVRLLADMVEDTISTEQVNVMTTMMAIASGLGPRLTDQAAGEVAKSLGLYSIDKALSPEHLVGALAVALRVDDKELIENISREEALWDDPERLKDVAMMSPDMPDSLVKQLGVAMAAAIVTDATVLTEPLRELPEDRARELMAIPALAKETKRLIADASTDAGVRKALADGLLEAAFDE